MAVVRRATDKDATWARAWTVDTAAELGDIPEPRRGDVAFATDTGLYYTWRDDGTWEAPQAHSANLDEYAAVNPTAAGLALLDDADAAAQLATLGLALDINTWVPAIQFGGASVGMTYSLQVGRYIKIGRLVWVEAAIVVDNKGSSTGNATVSLPFVPDTSVSAVIFGTLAITGLTEDINVLNWGSGPGSAFLDIRQGGRRGSAPTWLTDANFGSSSFLFFTCTFRTAA